MNRYKILIIEMPRSSERKFLEKIRKNKREQTRAKTLAINDLINEKEIYYLDLAKEKGASGWLANFSCKDVT